MKKITVLFMALFLFCLNVNAEDISLATNAKSALLLEASTGEFIYSKNVNEKSEPASLTKMMSMLLILESIDKGVISWDEMVTASANASGMGGSQILLEINERMSVEDLFKGVAVASGNDAVVALAEKIAGTEANFVNLMNKRAKELGLKNTYFKNSHGLTTEGHYTTAADLSVIARELVKHEELFKYTSLYESYLRENTNRRLWLVNTNKLVRFYEGVDGLKTGYTTSAGYCLVATAKKNNMRIIAIVMDEPTSEIRNKEVSEMLDYAFAQYELETAIDASEIVATKEVEKGYLEKIDVVPIEKVTYLKNKMEEKAKIDYTIDIKRLTAPIKKGDVVGSMRVKINNYYEVVNLTVKEDVNKITFFQLLGRKLKIFI